MKRQLALLEDTPTVWRLDEHTREVGRQGIARAREALRQVERTDAAPDRVTPDPAHRSAA
jgi:hypothetical protein